MSDALLTIPSTEWPHLRDLYLVNWPENCYGFYTIDNYVKWMEKGANLGKYQIYCLNGDWSDGTFIIEVSDFW